MERAIAIVGSRTFPVPRAQFERLTDAEKEEAFTTGYAFVHAFMKRLDPKTTRIVSGGAKGVDTWATEIASELGFLESHVIRPDWSKGRGAGFHRNKLIAQAADDVVAFWDLESKGTQDTIAKARKLGKPLAVFGPTGELLQAITEEDYEELRKLLPKMEVPKGKQAGPLSGAMGRKRRPRYYRDKGRRDGPGGTGSETDLSTEVDGD